MSIAQGRSRGDHRKMSADHVGLRAQGVKGGELLDSVLIFFKILEIASDGIGEKEFLPFLVWRV